jgi:hypothetical protein
MWGAAGLDLQLLLGVTTAVYLGSKSRKSLQFTGVIPEDVKASARTV